MFPIECPTKGQLIQLKQVSIGDMAQQPHLPRLKLLRRLLMQETLVEILV